MSVDWPRKLRTLYSPQQMRGVLHRERLRADRAGGRVSVAVFEVERTGRWRMRRLARLALKRARLTDEVGWMSPTQLGAVLPETDAFGAFCFANAVRAHAARRGLDVRYTLYTYPYDDSGLRTFGRRAESLASHPHFRGVPEAVPEATGEEAVGRGASAMTLAPLLSSALASALASSAAERRGLRAAVSAGMLAEGLGGAVLPLHQLLHEPLPAWKRAMDVVGATVGLLVAAPIMVAAAALIRLSSAGPVIFRQLRAGLGDSRFTIFKFRTMVPDAERLKPGLRAMSEQDGPAFKMARDPRVTWIGRFLRVTSLDELPQLWNVLRGTMSLVGPRPLPVDEAEECGRWHRRRLDVVPGLTCIWQVRGRSRVNFDDWMRMDMEYIHNRSFLNDLKILLLTVPAVVLRRGAH